MSDTAAVFSPATNDPKGKPARPVLIDPADGACEICAAWTAAREAAGKPVCGRCGKAVLPFQNMGGNGFQSVKPDHYHLEMVGSEAGRRCRYAELCHECYLADHKAVYPDTPLPSLPLVVVDINRRDDPKLFRAVIGAIESGEGPAAVDVSE